MGIKETFDTIVEDGAIFRKFVKGTATETVTTDGGAIPTLAKFTQDTAASLLQRFSATSVTSNPVGLGARTFQIQAGKGYVAGQWVSVGSGALNMVGTVTSYTGTTLVINVVHITGTGSASAWTISLSGPKGVDGTGTGGGGNGKSAYELAVERGYVGTLDQWLSSLEGEPGEPGGRGPDGADAYEVAVRSGFVGSRALWLASLKGPPGDSGNGSGGPTLRLITKMPWE